MFCGNTAGEFIPPMVVHKSEQCHENPTKGDYNNTVYDCITNRWFDFRMFQTWFFKKFRKHQEKEVVLIGDNLGSHFSLEVINPCVENNIFICLPPNTTHFCQPLRVAAFHSAKIEWKDILDTSRHVSRRKDKRHISLNALKVDAEAKTIKFNC